MELFDFLYEVLTSQFLANLHPCKVTESEWLPSLFLEECEFIVRFCHCLMSAVSLDVFHTNTNPVKWCFGHYVLLCQANNALLGFAQLAAILARWTNFV